MDSLNGINAGMVGSPLVPTKNSELERAAQRRLYYKRRAEAASGVGEPDGEDHQTADRDADNRCPWDPPPERNPATPEEPQSKDPSHESGNFLDFSG